MGHTTIDWPAGRSTLSAAVLSAMLAAGVPALGEAYAKLTPKQDVRWNAPDASQISFQGTAVSHGNTSATTSSVDSDPWQELEALQAGWDGNEAEPVSRDAIGHAKRFLQSLPLIGSTFVPFAHPNGSVGLEAQKPGKAAYLIVSATDRFAYVLRIAGTIHRGNDGDASVMRDLLDLLY